MVNPMIKRVSGIKGELEAVEYLINNGYRIIQKNYKNKIGEIDVVAIDREYLCFIEVKKRETSRYGLPREAVNRQKQEKIKKVATFYLVKNKQTEAQVRFDVVDILGNEITLIKNAF